MKTLSKVWPHLLLIIILMVTWGVTAFDKSSTRAMMTLEDMLCPLENLSQEIEDVVDEDQSKTDWLFDDNAPVRRFEVTVEPTDWQWLKENQRLETYVPATVTFEGEVFSAAIRYKGANGSLHKCFDEAGNLICDRLALKIKFNEYDKAGRFYGVRKLNFHAMEHDPTYLHERLGYALYREAGIAASRTTFSTISVNGEDAQLYIMVEAVDKEFVEDHFDDASGNLYKEIWPQHLDPGPYRHALKTNEETGDVGRVQSFAELLQSDLAPEDFNAAIEPWIDREAMARYFVIDQFIQNQDGIWKFFCIGGRCSNHNFYIYDDIQSGRFVVIPWDLDHTFNAPNADLARSWFDTSPEACEIEPVQVLPFEFGVRAPQCDPLLQGLMQQSWDLYLEAFDEMLRSPDGPLNPEVLLARLDRYRAQLCDVIAEETLGPDLEEWSRAVVHLRQIIRKSVAEAEVLLDE